MISQDLAGGRDIFLSQPQLLGDGANDPWTAGMDRPVVDVGHPEAVAVEQVSSHSLHVFAENRGH